MYPQNKKTLYTIGVSIILTLILLLTSPRFQFYIQYFNGKTYDLLNQMDIKFHPAPPSFNKVVLIGIDNPTVMHMPYRWPYPRTVFAKIVDNLKNAGAKIIAFDFVFIGKSEKEDEDIQLKKSLENAGAILATSIDEEGNIGLYSNGIFQSGITSGIVTKITDADGIARKKFAYLINFQDPNKAYLSWGMQILKKDRDIDLSTFDSQTDFIAFKSRSGEYWKIPVEPKTKDFLIRFRAHTFDFPRISLYKIYTGDFNPLDVKNKIALIGFISTVFADLHNTPIGWLPGITLNANGFLTISNHDFIKSVPWYIDILIILIGVIIAAYLASLLHVKRALIYIGFFGMAAFYFSSYLLFTHNYIWNYSLFPVAILVCPSLAKKIVDFSENLWFNK